MRNLFAPSAVLVSILPSIASRRQNSPSSPGSFHYSQDVSISSPFWIALYDSVGAGLPVAVGSIGSTGWYGYYNLYGTSIESFYIGIHEWSRNRMRLAKINQSDKRAKRNINKICKAHHDTYRVMSCTWTIRGNTAVRD